MKPGTKLRQNINFIDHIAFIYNNNENLLEAKRGLSATMGLDADDWEDPFDDVHPSYAHIELCWRVGIELLCPQPGHETDWIFHDLITKRGEGLATVVMGVPDLNDACDRAEKAGFRIIHRIEDSRHPDAENVTHEMGEPLKQPFRIMREAMLAPFASIQMAFGQIEPKEPA